MPSPFATVILVFVMLVAFSAANLLGTYHSFLFIFIILIINYTYELYAPAIGSTTPNRRTGSVTRAAEQLFITQPAASIQLKKLQDQFELPLLEHVGRKVYLTDFGKGSAATASRILDELYAVHYRALAHKGLLTGKLTVSVVSTGKYVMPYLLSPFMKIHQNLELQMEVTNKEQVVASLNKTESTFGFHRP